MAFVLNVAAILGWVERKQSAIMQDRIGANRASIFGFRALGLFHPLADTLKMLTKEDFRPARADRLLFELAPFVSVFFSLVAFASIPFGDTLTIGDRVVPLQAITLNVGILYVFAMLSLGVYGVMMAGWSSSNNYALLGGQRAAALMISAEIAIGASIMGVVMIYGSLNLQDIVRGQGTAASWAGCRPGASSPSRWPSCSSSPPGSPPPSGSRSTRRKASRRSSATSSSTAA